MSEMIERKCCRPGCGRSIFRCNGFVKAGDLNEWQDGTRKAEDVREVCGRCTLVFRWNQDGELVRRSPEELAEFGVAALSPASPSPSVEVRG